MQSFIMCIYNGYTCGVIIMIHIIDRNKGTYKIWYRDIYRGQHKGIHRMLPVTAPDS